MTTERLTTIRVRINEKLYCDVTQSVEDKDLYEFTLHLAGYANSVYMFSVYASNEEEICSIVEDTYEEYIGFLGEEDDD